MDRKKFIFKIGYDTYIDVLFLQLNSLLNWLHSSKQPSSSNQKWLFLDLRFTPMEMIVDFLEDIKKV